jgi:flagellar basal body-associated protein FliL
MSGMQPQQSYQSPGAPQPQGGQPPSNQFFQPSTPQMGPPAPNANSAPPSFQPVAHSSGGGVSKLPLILAIVFGVLTLALGGFGVWAFAERQDYKNNSDQKAAAAAEAASKQTSDSKDAEFLEREKEPYRTYVSPDATGAIKIVYPKSWSAYIDESDKSKPAIGYWHPATVPGLKSGTAYALRLEVTNRSYSEEVKSYDAGVRSGAIKISPYVPKNVSGITGARVTGEINKGQKDTMIVLPLRDKTVRIWTESPDFVKDFDNVVLANLTFTP